MTGVQTCALPISLWAWSAWRWIPIQAGRGRIPAAAKRKWRSHPRRPARGRARTPAQVAVSSSEHAASATEVVAELEQLTRTYRMGQTQVHALDGISFRFLRGEYWAVMGSSGSGKSTLLNILGCLDQPSSGIYRVRGQDTRGLSDDQLSAMRSTHLGFVFQSYNLIAQLNVLENILVPLFYQDQPPPGGEARAKHLAQRVGLADRLHHRPSELSGGQQQRVAIARALINDPALILADEATGNLDSQTALEILALFDELHAEGKTIVLVTHEASVGARAQNILRLKDGRVESVQRKAAGAPALAGTSTP